jgi:hypothetical protein
MINAIGEATIQQAIRAHHNNSTNGKETVEIKADQITNDRPVEKTSDNSKSEMDLQHNLNTTTRHIIENGKIIFERYDENGQLIQQIPPGYVPFGERV